MRPTILSLDIGEARTGVARAYKDVGIANPFVTLTSLDTLAEDVASLVKSEDAQRLVVGLPRNLNGEDTQQTAFVRTVVAEIQKVLTIPVDFVDEALTSVKAEKELAARKKPFSKADIDMLSATYILEDYLAMHRNRTTSDV